MKGISMLSVIERMCSELDLDTGPNIATTPFSVNITMYPGNKTDSLLTQEVASLPLRSEGVILRYVDCLCMELYPAQDATAVHYQS